jgi:hypothetical protein
MTDEKPEFYRAIGHAITRWQAIESSLCDVFVRVSTCRNPTIASAIFYTSHDFSVKLALTRNAARLILVDPLVKEWDAFRTRLKSESEVRNSLAHFHPGGILGPSRPSTLVLTPRYI